MKVWITKYALSTGIFEADAQPSNISVDMIVVPKGAAAYDQHYHGEGKDWHCSLESARERAESMRENKIASLRKQLAKLEKMRF